MATGHLGRGRALRYENELLALAKGGLSLVEEDAFTVVDVGSRDTKLCRFRERSLDKLDWNQSCGATTGFTLELLGRYYQLDWEALPLSEERAPVVCSVLGLERIFESIVGGASAEEAVAAFVHGVAFNLFNFASRPERLYLSGGLCENPCFTRSLARYCEVVPLGRGVLLEGIRSEG
ncbi:MAG: ATPase [Nitrospinota bacterium]